MLQLIDILKITLPSLVVLYAMYLIVKSFLAKQFEVNLSNLKMENSKTILPLRLQAYERMAIFLERITPNNLIMRLNDRSLNVAEFQQLLVFEIRQELNHNLSQQIYMSDEVWNMIKKATEETISLINKSAEPLDKQAPSIELAKKIFENVIASDFDNILYALRVLKNEIRTFY